MPLLCKAAFMIWNFINLHSTTLLLYLYLTVKIIINYYYYFTTYYCYLLLLITKFRLSVYLRAEFHDPKQALRFLSYSHFLIVIALMFHTKDTFP